MTVRAPLDFQSVRSKVSALIAAENLPPHFVSIVERWYVPIAARVADTHAQQDRPILVSVSCAQGSGKSTLTTLVRLLLKEIWQLNAVDVSLDDFYLTHAERQQLAQDVHPLLATRGVPGTHDLRLACEVLDRLHHCSASQPCKVPRFDKSMDDRQAKNNWTQIEHSVDVILFEGWCLHAPVAEVNSLADPINTLEQQEDPDGVWRRYVNTELARYHPLLFSQTDLLVYIAIPGFDQVYEWRQLQEQKLAERVGSRLNKSVGVMNSAQLSRFIQHYERITRRCLEVLPQTADLVLSLNATHGVEDLQLARFT